MLDDLPRKRMGRPPGPSTTKPWKDALRLALQRNEPQSGRRYLDLVAERCVEAALQGDMQAVAEIGNRLDGRALVIEGSDANPVTLVSRIERVIVDVAQDAGGSMTLDAKPITH